MLDIQDRELSPEAVSQLVKAMIAVAGIDGVSAAERVLIEAFHRDSTGADLPAALWTAAFDRAAAIAALSATPGVAVQSCLLAAYADGAMSAGELAFTRDFAAALGVDAAAFAQTHDAVRDALLAQFAQLPDSASVARVAGELYR